MMVMDFPTSKGKLSDFLFFAKKSKIAAPIKNRLRKNLEAFFLILSSSQTNIQLKINKKIQIN